MLTGDGILAWGASTASPLKDSPQIKQLLEFLEEDSDESGSEEEESD